MNEAQPLLRPPRASEQLALHALCMRAKASWGYDARFMAACAPVLHVDPDRVREGLVMVASVEERALGVAQLGLDDELAEVELLFVEPAHQRAGVGRLLMGWLVARAREAGAQRLGILADPGARAFYEAQGARYVRDEPSEIFARRSLPWLELGL
jgi:GNAT superfamily N-acetyltransferase